MENGNIYNMLIRFFNICRQMRQAQKEYFSTRSSESLNRARGLEIEVDKMLTSLSKLITDIIISRAQQEKGEQGNLF